MIRGVSPAPPAQSLSHRQEEVEMPNPVTHFEVLGNDAETLRRFYGEAFEWQMQDVMNGSYYMANPGTDHAINGGVGATPEGGSGHVTFYVEVEDPAAALQKISELGGKTIQEPIDVPNGPTIALFADPEGHVVGLVKSA
jgi:predicted enzyme related to lactoylglutathione lyase